MTDLEVLEVANEIVRPRGLKAEFFKDVYSVGVGGDFRTYTKVIVLVGPYPGNDTLSSLSTKIGNMTGINRITIELIKKDKIITEKSPALGKT